MKITPSTWLIALLLLICAISPALAAAKLQVVVTSSSGHSVYINQGSTSGLTKGLRVRFHMFGGPSIEGVIVGVTKSSARVELPPDAAVPIAGTTGEIELAEVVKPDAVVAPASSPSTQPATSSPTSPATGPATTATTQPTTQPATQPSSSTSRKVPEHPAWRRNEPVADEDEPLLSIAMSRRPEERPSKTTGRVWTDVTYSQDPSSSNNGSKFTNIHTGLSLQMTNPIGHGGRFQFEGLAQDQYTDTSSGSDNKFEAAPQLLSYAQGGEENQPYRFEVGRYYSVYLPELGLIDGAEGAIRFDNGFSLGVGIGAFPHLFPNLKETKDYGFFAFMQYESEEPGELAATLGYAKIWHEGKESSDQILGRVNAHLIEPLWLFGSFRVDIYTDSNNSQGSGVDLTQAWGQARYSIMEDFGVGVSVSHYVWTQVMKDELDSLSKIMIADGRVDRGEIFTWYDVTKTLRLGGNINYWSDKENDGLGGEADADWSPEWLGPSFHLALYETDGASATGRGARFELRKTFEKVDGFLGYEIFDYSTNSSGGNDQIRHAVRGGINFRRNAWYYGITGHYYFGDGQEVLTLGLHVEYRF